MVQKLIHNSVPSKKTQYKFFNIKKDRSFFFKKFSFKIKLDILLWKILKSSELTKSNLYLHDLEIKKQFYKFLKILKLAKLLTFFSLKPSNIQEFGFKLQVSGLNSSLCEVDKKRLLQKLKLKLLKFQSLKILQISPSFYRLVQKTQEKEKAGLLQIQSIGKSFQKFENAHFAILQRSNQDDKWKKNSFLKFLKSKYFYTRICETRILALASSLKKRYCYPSTYTEKLQKNILTLFTLYPITKKKFLNKCKEKHRIFKKLVWKRKKRTKMKKRMFLRFLGFKKRFSTKFYVPKHLEINFKTLNLIYLGFTDSKTINPRLPFWLNLRKLVTFLSK